MRRCLALFFMLVLAVGARAQIRVERTFQVNQTITDLDYYTSSNTVSFGISNITDVNVSLTLSSPQADNPMWLGDLYATLTYGVASEQERVAVLLNRPGRNPSNWLGSDLTSLNVTLDDSVSATNVYYATNSTGTYAADGRINVDPYADPVTYNPADATAGLSAINGVSLASNRWSLFFADTSEYGVAKLDSWRLIVSGLAANSGTLDAGPGGLISDAGTTNTVGAVVVVDGSGTNGVTARVTNGLVFNAGLQGSGQLFKDGAGTLTLGGSSTNFSGVIVVSAGALRGDTTSLRGTITNNATLIFNQTTNNATAFSGLLGSGATVKEGSGTLLLGSATNYTGAITLNAGGLSLASSSALGTGALTVNGGSLGSTNAQRTLANNIVAGGNFTLGVGDQATTFSGAFDLGGGTRTITLENSATINGIISNGGIILNNGASGSIWSFILGASNTFSGGLVNNGATVKLSTNGSLASSAVNLAATQTNATLDITNVNGAAAIGSLTGATNSSVILGTNTLSAGGNNASTTFAGVVSGTGALAKAGTGTMTLTGANTYSGGTLISAGALIGNTTSLQGSITNNGVVIFDQAVDGAYSSVLSGNGRLLKTNSGALTLSGANTQSGGVLIGGGTLSIGAGGSSGSLAGPITNNGVLVFNRSDNFTHSGVVSGAGILTKLGSGTVTLSATNGYSGGTLVSAGALAGDSASLQGAITNNGAVIFNQSVNGTYAGVLSGSGTLLKTDSGTLTLSGANTQSGGTLISAGSLQIGNGGTTGSLSGPITNNSALIFNRSDNLTQDGIIRGNGLLSKTGAGTLTLSGANSYSGGTLVSAGTLAGDTTSLSGGITNNATLSFSQATNGAYGGTISGTGSFQKSGPGTVTTTGNNSFSGATTVSAGRLVVNGTNANSAVTTVGGASIGGTGQVGALTVSGLIAPGNSVGTLSAGNTMFNTNGSFELEIFDFAGAAGTGWDLLAVTGSLTLSNKLTNPFTVNLVSMTNGATAGLSSFNPNLNYTNTFVTYTGSLAGTSFSPSIFAVNTNNFQNAVNGSFSVSTNSGGLALVYTTLFNPNAAYTWTNGSGNWSVSSAWTNNFAPTNGAVIVFSGGAGNATNNAQVSALASLTFSNTTGSIVLNGSPFTIGTNGIVNLSGNAHAISNNIALTGPTTFDSASNNLTFAGNITNGGYLLTLSGNNNTGISGVISGSGNVTKSGSGTVILSGANTYSGGTLVGAGTLQGSTASLQGPITNNGVVVFDQSADGTYSSVLSGTGSLLKTNGGTLTLSGANTYSGGTLVGAGALQGSTASLQGPITNNGVVVFDQSADGTYSSVLSGTGSLLKTNSGTLVITSSVTQTGTTIGQGTLQVGNNGTTGSLAGPITNNGVLVFNRSDNLTASDIISGTGSVTKSGSGTVILSGSNTYSGGTLVGAGALQGSTASLQGPITNNGVVIFDQASSGTYGGVLSGTGSLLKTNGGTLTLSGANMYSGGTLVSAGALAGNSTSLQGPITNNGVVVFDQSADGTYSSVLSGTGSLLKTNSGTLTLSGANTQSGGALIAGGTLSIGAGGASGSLSGPITNNGVLVFNRSDNLTASDIISGTGSVTKSGSGTVILSGSNTYSGGTLVGAGALVGNSTSLQGAINNNGTLVFNQSTVSSTTNASISGATGILIKEGQGAVILGNNTYGGGTILNQGAIHLASANALGTGALTMSNGTALASVTSARTIANSVSLLGNVTFGLASGGQSTSFNGSVDLGGATRTISLLNSATIGGAITNGGLTIDNPASSLRNLTLTGINTFASGLTVNGGNVILSGSGSLNSSAAVNLAAATTNASLDISAITANALAVGSLAGGVNSSLALGAKSLTLSGNSSTVYAGSISGAGGSIVKQGSGTITLAGSNSHTGGITLASGGIVAANNNALGSAAMTLTNGSLQLAGGVTIANDFTIGAFSYSTNRTTNNFTAYWNFGTSANPSNAATTTSSGTGVSFGSVTSGNNAGAAVFLTNSTTSSGAYTNASGSYNAGVNAWGGALSNGSTFFAFSVTASNGYNLSLTNLTFGTRSVSQGPTNFTLMSSIDNYASALATNLIDNAGSTWKFNTPSVTASPSTNGAVTFRMYGSGGTGGSTASNWRIDDLTISGISITSSITTNPATGSATLGIAGAGSAIYSGNITVNGAATLEASNGGKASFTGVISGAGTITKSGAGTIELIGANSYTGGTALSAGKLTLSGASAAGGGAIVQSDGNSTLEINTTGVLSNAMNVYNISTLQSVTLSGNKTMNNTTFTVAPSTTTTDSGILSGAGGITKEGAGILVLTGNNTYSGPVAVNAGLLSLNSTVGGAAASAASVSVATGAALLVSQSNQVNNAAAISLSGGTIRRGSGVSEVFGNLSLTAASFLDFGGGTAGTLSFGTYTPSSLLTVNNFFQGNSLTFGSNLGGSVSNGSLFSFDNGFTTNWNSATGTFTITAIPEPSSLLALAGTLVFLLLVSCRSIFTDRRRLLSEKAATSLDK